jgi:chromosome segregation ATPase
MHRSTALILSLMVTSTVPTFSQSAPSESQTLQGILAEVRQLRHDLETTSAMAARAQIAIYRVQQENEAVDRATQRVSEARQRVEQLEDARNHKAQNSEQDRASVTAATSPSAQQEVEEVALPQLTSELEHLEIQEQQARAEQAKAERQLRDELAKLDRLNDLLDRYDNALEKVGRDGK